MRSERHGHELQTANRKSQHLQQKETTLGEHPHGDRVGRLPNDVVHNRAHSSGKGPAHMENTENILTINIVGWLISRLVWNRPSWSEKVPAHWQLAQN